jgi:hypothetical protein
MPNKTIKDDVVKWFSKKKYTCKRNRGEHEWGEPVITYPPKITYQYKTEGGGMLISHQPEKDRGKFLRAEISLITEVRCIHCGKKATNYLSDKI